MTEVIFAGPEGRLEGRYHHNKNANAPLALILHPEPSMGGHMNSKVTYTMFQTFARMGFSVLRFNFRGIGKSQGMFEGTQSELSDAAAALDWMQTINNDAATCWVAGHSFGAWIGMQLLMRRPEIEGFISVSAPAAEEDFSFLAPCPSSGLFIHGCKDMIVPDHSVTSLVARINEQKNIHIDCTKYQNADHMLTGHLRELDETVEGYVKESMKRINQKKIESKKRAVFEAEKELEEELAAKEAEGK